MVELVDTQDLKSCDRLVVRVQVPLLVHASFLEKGSFFYALGRKLSFPYIVASLSRWGF